MFRTLDQRARDDVRRESLRGGSNRPILLHIGVLDNSGIVVTQIGDRAIEVPQDQLVRFVRNSGPLPTSLADAFKALAGSRQVALYRDDRSTARDGRTRYEMYATDGLTPGYLRSMVIARRLQEIDPTLMVSLARKLNAAHTWAAKSAHRE